MDFYKEALVRHAATVGKVETVSKMAIKDADDLSVAYTPGVAEPCRKIAENPEDAYRYTCKANTVAVVSNGTAVLGLGNIGAQASLPVMEGKCVLFKQFGGLNAFPICIDCKTPAEVIATVKAIAPSFGGINLEDIKSPDCFEIETTLEREMDIPVFHDDQHGTAVVVTAALLNALKVVGKRIEDAKIVLNGAGAAGTAIIKMMMHAGAKNVIPVDIEGVLHRGMAGLTGHKAELAETTNPENVQGTLADALVGADVFVGVSVGGILKPEMIATMAKDPIVFAMANPTPEIGYDEGIAAGVAVMGTGRSDKPNQINNLLCFPGLFKGALAVRARDINYDMKLAAARAISDLVDDETRSRTYIIPSVFDTRIAPAVARAVAQAAVDTGVARAPMPESFE